MAKYPWEEIKAKYETGKYTMQELADEYGFNRDYGFQKAGREGWEKGKTNKKLIKEAAKKVLESEADKEAKLRQEYAKIIKNIRRGTANELFNEQGTSFDRLKQFKIASQIMGNCRSEDWELNEIQEVAKKIDQKIDIDKNAINMSEEEKKSRLEELRAKLGD